MAINLKDPEIEQLAAEVAELAGETTAEAIRRALIDRRERLVPLAERQDRAGSFLDYLETEVWPKVPQGLLGRRLPKATIEEVLGYGPDGM